MLKNCKNTLLGAQQYWHSNKGCASSQPEYPILKVLKELAELAEANELLKNA